MLRLAAAEARERNVSTVSWMLGFDTDLPALTTLLGPGTIGAVTVATAIHWMDHAALFATARAALRSGGGVAVVTNGAPLWLQDTDWSRALRAVLQEWTGRDAGWTCGTDEKARAGYRDAMSAAGYATDELRVEYDAELDVDTIVGGLLSAMPAHDVEDPSRREDFTSRVFDALPRRNRFDEHVAVTIQTGTIGSRTSARRSRTAVW